MKKSIALILTAATALALVGCGKEKTAEKQSAPLLTNPVVTLNGYENQEELSRMAITGSLGKITVNTDKANVKGGGASAKVFVQSEADALVKQKNPKIVQSTKIEKTGEDYSDFKKVKTITLDVFNDQEAARQVGLQLVYPSGTELIEYFTLPAKAWTTLRYDVTREYVPVIKDIEGNTTLKVKYVNVIFPRQATAGEYYYLDNFLLYRTDTEVAAITKTLESSGNVDEICSFDKQWQIKGLGVGTASYSPTVSQTKSLTSTGYGSSIRIDTNPDENISQWPSVSLPLAMTALVDWEKYDGDDVFCFDVYAPLENGMTTFYLTMDSSTRYLYQKYTIEAGKWTTVSLTVDEINANPEYTQEYNFSTTTRLSFGYRQYIGERKTLYLDNIRMIRNGTNA